MTENDFQNLIGWNDGKDENYLRQWAGPTYKYPLTLEQITTSAKRAKEENIRMFMILNDKKPIGSVSLGGINVENSTAHVFRFIICDEEKNKGFGSSALKLLSLFVFNDMKLKKLLLNVYCYNVGAIRCYEKCGFLVKEYRPADDPKWNGYKIIRPMTEEDFQNLIDWNDGKDENYLSQWAGPTYKYPLTIEQIYARAKEENNLMFTIVRDEKAIGGVDLSGVDMKNSAAHICRFILCDDEKGNGAGTAALKQLSSLAFNEMKLKRLSLYVYCYNVGAIRCYEKGGFLVKEYSQADNPKWSSYKMELVNAL